MKLGKCLTSPRNMTISQYPTTVNKTQESTMIMHMIHNICLTILQKPLRRKRNKNKILAVIDEHLCFLIKEFQRCMSCFSSLETSTKSSSICNIKSSTLNNGD
jgi:retron-type reverse transcriptase